MDNIYNVEGDIFCGGELACIGSTIAITGGSGDWIMCYAAFSCKDSIITTFGLRSHFMSTVNSLIYPNADNAEFYFYGVYSGYNATVICNDGYTCNIYCYNNGCNDLTLKCENNDNGCTFNIDCIYAELSNNCPNGMFTLN